VGGRSALCLEGFIMADRTIEHHWQQDPNIPQVVTGVSGGDGTAAGGGSLITKDLTVAETLTAILVELRKLNMRQEVVFEEIITDGDIIC